MENSDFLPNFDDILYPEYQEEIEEKEKIKKEEKEKKREEYKKNHPEYFQFPEDKEDYIKNKKKERKFNKRQRAKKKVYQIVKNMTKEEKQKFYDNYYLEKEKKKQEQSEGLKKAFTSNFIICFDLDYNIYMDKKEIKSLVSQLSLCYCLNKYNKNKINYYFTNINQEIINMLNKNNGVNWYVHNNEKPFYLIEELVNTKKEFIYLSPDAEEDLEDVSEDKIYIVGGLVDRTVVKNRSMIRFNNIKHIEVKEKNEIKISAKRLPLQKYVDNIANPILNINTVIEILSRYMDMDKDQKDWKKAIECALPKRKLENK